MVKIRHDFVETNGIRMHVAHAGEGSLVVLCHGFPETWYSWRHQLRALAEAGFHAVAPDQRGYGQTERPEDVTAYTTLHLVGDAVGLVDTLGEKTAIIVGHDVGAPVAWHAAVLRPDIFRAVVGLSGAYAPRGDVRPTDGMRARFGERFLHPLYFQDPGIAEKELEADPRRSLRTILYSVSGSPPVPAVRPPPKMRGAGFLDGMEDPPELPAWLIEADIDAYAQDFERTGFTGALNWYRCMDRSWELLAPFRGAKVTVPALFIAGDRDGGVVIGRAAYDELERHVPNLRGKVLLPGVGHWTQQEAANEVNRALIEFFRGID